MGSERRIQIPDFSVIEHFGEGCGASKVAVFDLHHIRIKALIGGVGMDIGVFEQKALPQRLGMDELEYLSLYLMAVVG